MTERDIQNAILVAVTALPGAFFWRAQSGLSVTAARNVIRSNVPGCADIIGCLRGRAVAIEVKTASGRQSESQRRFHAAWVAAGGAYLIGRSAEQVLRDLEPI